MRIKILVPAFLLTCVLSASAAVPGDCWTMRMHGHRQEAEACFERLTGTTDAYSRAEGFWGLGKWDQANEQFRLATQPASSKALYKVRWGMLLHERFNDPEAADLFHEALAKDPSNSEAYVGLAISFLEWVLTGEGDRVSCEGHRARSETRRTTRFDGGACAEER